MKASFPAISATQASIVRTLAESWPVAQCQIDIAVATDLETRQTARRHLAILAKLKLVEYSRTARGWVATSKGRDLAAFIASKDRTRIERGSNAGPGGLR